MTERANDSIKWTPLEGGCVCRAVRYRVEAKPLFVHCCHCRWCQRETGSAFVLNALVEAEQVKVLAGESEIIDTPSQSGKGQKIARCPKCRVALWSNYYWPGPSIRFVRVGTLDDPDRVPPDIHIFTSSKQRWVVLPRDAVAVTEFYSAKERWPQESLRRAAAARAGKSRAEP